jgi:hypothetical protein
LSPEELGCVLEEIDCTFEPLFSQPSTVNSNPAQSARHDTVSTDLFMKFSTVGFRESILSLTVWANILPVLCSDHNPARRLDKRGQGWDIKETGKKRFHKVMEA